MFMGLQYPLAFRSPFFRENIIPSLIRNRAASVLFLYHFVRLRLKNRNKP